MKSKKVMTNKEFTGKDETFKNTCKAAGLKVTTRQASKFRRGMGRAYAYLATHGHQGDPCRHCGVPHDQIGLGPCPGR